jgi:hypothetical protein
MNLPPTKNEHICASALYYYDSVNVTTSQLAFRHQVDSDESMVDIYYPQNHDEWLEEIFGCENWASAIQNIGSVVTSEDRLLTWPNVLQHQVQPFEIEDPTKPGHRKILALFLVDPHIRVISTSRVPPQRLDWWTEATLEEEPSPPLESVLGNAFYELPTELKTRILKEVDDFPISLEEAKEIRLELMDERSVYSDSQDSAFQQREFSLCEH